LKEGWIPAIPAPDIPSIDLYGTCDDIIFKTDDDESIVHEFPDPSTLDPNNWQGVAIDDDVVVSHGQSLVKDGKYDEPIPLHTPGAHDGFGYVGFALFAAMIFIIYYFFKKKYSERQRGYIEVQELSVTV